MAEATDHASLIQLAQKLLTESTSSPIKIKNIEKLASQHLVLRCQIEPPPSNLSPSVILKQITTTEFNNRPESTGESQRFLNEQASLEFLSNLPGDTHYGPRLLASRRTDNLIILEDFGEHQSVQDLLLGSDHAAAQKGILAIGRFLGQIQAAAYNREDEFATVQSRLNTTSPLSDSTIDFRARSKVFQDCFATLQITPARGFWEALENLEQTVHNPGPFYTFTHCDAGPHNFLYINGNVQLLDYEFATFHHGLLDVVSARLGFPHTSKVQSVPLETAKQLERAYQREVAHAIPQIIDDTLFGQAIADACAHWALSRWSGSWTRYFKERFEMGDEAINKKMEFTTEKAETMRSKALTLYQSFIQCAQQSNHQLALAETLQSYTRRLKQEWPELEVMPIYPALR